MSGPFIFKGKKYFPTCDKVGAFRPLSPSLSSYFVVSGCCDDDTPELRNEDLTFLYCNLDPSIDDSKLNMITLSDLEEKLLTFINSDDISDCGDIHFNSFLCVKNEEDYNLIKDIVKNNLEKIISLFTPNDCDSFFKHPLSIYSDKIEFKMVMCRLVISPITEAEASINTYGRLFASSVGDYLDFI
jgi:hypothetical protein